MAIVRDDLTTDGLTSVSQRADDGLILLGALVAGIALGGVARPPPDGAPTPSSSTRGSSARRSTRAARSSPAARRCSCAIGALAVSERGVTGTIEDASGTTSRRVKSDDQTDPARVLRSNSGNRWVWWREAAGAFSDEPLRGWGAGSFPLVHRRYRENDLPVRQAHSVPLQFLAETGLVGALLALGGLGLLGWAAVARLRPGDGPRAALRRRARVRVARVGGPHVVRLGLGHPRRHAAAADLPRRARRAAAGRPGRRRGRPAARGRARARRPARRAGCSPGR